MNINKMIGCPGKRRWWNIFAIAIIVVSIILTSIWIIVRLWPYNDVSVKWEGGIEAEEWTSEGIPVIRSSEYGGYLHYKLDYCNTGVDVRTVRWLDSYGPEGSAPDLNPPRDAVSSSRFVSETFYPITEVGVGCFENLEVEVRMPHGPPTGVYYRMRSVSTYYPNFLAEVDYTTYSDLFYFAEGDEELP